MTRLRKKIIYWLQYKGFYILRKMQGLGCVFMDGLGNKYYMINKTKENTFSKGDK